MVEDAVPCQPAVAPENDENSALQAKVGVRLAGWLAAWCPLLTCSCACIRVWAAQLIPLSNFEQHFLSFVDSAALQASLPGKAPASAERALRPSSRQDNLGGAADSHPPPHHKAAGRQQQAAAALASALEGPAPAGAAAQQAADGEGPLASVSIGPPAEDSEGGDSRLVLLLRGQPQQAQPPAVPAVPAAAAATEGECGEEEGDVCSMVLLAEAARLNSSEAEDAEAMLDAQEVSQLLHPTIAVC